MQFVSSNKYIYPWPVKVVRPSREKVGELVTEEFVAKFCLQDDSTGLEVAASLQEAKTAEAYVAATKDQIRRILVGWDEATVLDEEAKQRIPFSPAALDAFLVQAPFRDAVLRAYGESLAKRPVEGN